MKTETRYKLVALGFFFSLFAALFMQFVHPYTLSTGASGQMELHNNYRVFPFIVIPAVFLSFQWAWYPRVRKKVKLFPLIGSTLLMALLIYIHVLNRAQNIDPGTRDKIIKHLDNRR